MCCWHTWLCNSRISGLSGGFQTYNLSLFVCCYDEAFWLVVALGINGDSQSVDSVLVIMSPALADASEQAPAQPVSNGDDNQQQAEPVNQDSTVQVLHHCYFY